MYLDSEIDSKSSINSDNQLSDSSSEDEEYKNIIIKRKKFINPYTNRRMRVIMFDRNIIFRPREVYMQLYDSGEKVINVMKTDNGFFNKMTSLIKDTLTFHQFYQRVKIKNIRKRKYFIRTQKISNQISDFLITHLFNNLNKGKHSSIKELLHNVNKIVIDKISHTHMFKHIKNLGWKFSPKCIVNGIIPSSYHSLCSLFLNFLFSNHDRYEDILFFDTSSFRGYNATKATWSSGEGIKFGSDQKKSSVQVKLKMTYSYNQGVYLSEIEDVSINGKISFKNYLLRLINKIRSTFSSKVLLILDNETQHHNESVY